MLHPFPNIAQTTNLCLHSFPALSCRWLRLATQGSFSSGVLHPIEIIVTFTESNPISLTLTPADSLLRQPYNTLMLIFK